MGLFKIIFGVIIKFRDFLQEKAGSLFEKFRDPETGKVTFTSPRNLSRIFWTVVGVIFFIILAQYMFSGQGFRSGGIDDFQKEFTPKPGFNISTQDQRFSLENDPLAQLGESFRRQGPAEGLTTETLSGGGTTSSGEQVSLAECSDLIQMLRSGQEMDDTQKRKAQQCLDENVTGLSPEQIAIANALLSNPNLTPQERAFLERGLRGELTPEEMAVANALIGNDAAAKDLAKAAIASGNPDVISALGKQISGSPLTPEEQALISQLGQPSISSATGTTGPMGTDTQADVLQRTQDIANREGQIQNLEQQVNAAQAAAADALAKAAQGLAITPQERALIDNFNTLQKQLDEAKAINEARKKELVAKVAELQRTIGRVTATLNQALPTGSFIEFEDDICKPATALPFKKVAKKRTAKKRVDLAGRVLTPDEIQYLELRRKQSTDLEQGRVDALNPVGGLGNRITVSQVDGAPVITDLSSLFVFKDASLKQFQISPDEKIPAVLESQILISDKGRGQQIRVRILQDIYDVDRQAVVIPKGAIVLGMTSGFDPDIGVMDINFDSVVVKGKKVAARFNVGSADGTMGLKGQVRDTRGKYLLGTFITAFSAGALGYFSSQVVQPFQASVNAADALTGAGLQGGAEVMTRIAEMYASDLQGAAKVFYAPNNIPIILYPQ